MPLVGYYFLAERFPTNANMAGLGSCYLTSYQTRAKWRVTSTGESAAMLDRYVARCCFWFSLSLTCCRRGYVVINAFVMVIDGDR